MSGKKTKYNGKAAAAGVALGRSRAPGAQGNLAHSVMGRGSSVVSQQDRPKPFREGDGSRVYGAIDLGTNNCRLLVARPTGDSFRVIDAFSRTVRLGAGVAHSGMLADNAMRRTVDALRVCGSKIRRRNVTHLRAIATEACRIAENGPEFIERVADETGIVLEIITPEEEAKLAAAGCAPLVDPEADTALVFDIGGGSTELAWLDLAKGFVHGGTVPMAAWTSLPIGVVTLAERFGPCEQINERARYASMVSHVKQALLAFDGAESLRHRFESERTHLIGNSGTVTTLAGVHLQLDQYDRSVVDGAWLEVADLVELSTSLQKLGPRGRANHPCIGRDRSDLLLPGCAILAAIHEVWPTKRICVADRGLREGMLLDLMRRPAADLKAYRA